MFLINNLNNIKLKLLKFNLHDLHTINLYNYNISHHIQFYSL